MKTCSYCGVEKTADCFRPRRGECRDCRSKKKAVWRRHNPPTSTQMHRYYLKSRYDITPEDYDRMLAAQQGLCAICEEPPGEVPFRVDHCHATGKVRSLLHHGCNLGLGMFRDSAAILRRAATYIEHHRSS